MIAMTIIVPAMKSSSRAFYDGARYRVDESVGHLMHRTVLQMRRRIERRMADHGLTAAQWVPLWMLATGQADNAQAIACASHSDAGSVTRMLDRLEAKGLVARTRSAADRRVVQLELTDAGREVVREIPFVLADVNNDALRGFSSDDFEQLKSLLKRLHANVGALEEEENPTP